MIKFDNVLTEGEIREELGREDVELVLQEFNGDFIAYDVVTLVDDETEEVLGEYVVYADFSSILDLFED